MNKSSLSIPSADVEAALTAEFENNFIAFILIAPADGIGNGPSRIAVRSITADSFNIACQITADDYDERAILRILPMSEAYKTLVLGA